MGTVCDDWTHAVPKPEFAGISCRTAHPTPPHDAHRYPANTPKMPGEPKRVQPSRNTDLTRGNGRTSGSAGDSD